MVTLAHPDSSGDAAKPAPGSTGQGGHSGTELVWAVRAEGLVGPLGTQMNSALGRSSKWESGRRENGVERNKEASTC